MEMIRDWFGNAPLRIGLAADHGGVTIKSTLTAHLTGQGFQIHDFGPACLNPDDDYPDFAAPLARALVAGTVDCGILICRSGIGMSICANRFHGVRAALVESVLRARSSREHNAANVLVTGGDGMKDADLLAVVDTWLGTPFSNAPRHVRRLEKVETLTYDGIAAVRAVDPEIAAALDHETQRQDEGIELIASENFASTAVCAAVGSVMTNKYAEGYPGKRYYNGCEFVDVAEKLAIERACKLFGAEAANVQPHSGSQANMAAYFALIQPGDTVLAMSLDHGGHLTHGMKINFSGRLYNFVGYGVDPDTEQLNYDTIAELARQHRPKLIMAGASAYPRIIDFARLRAIADETGALLGVDMAHIAGLVATGLHPSPVPDADVVTSTTHKTLRGPRSGLILCKEKYLKAINSQVFPGLQGGPLMHVIAGKAVCFKEAMAPEFKAYQARVVANAKTLAGALQENGFRIVSGGTDNHLMLVDLRPKKVTGKEASTVLDTAAITVNKNMIPFDPEKPTVTSGIRIGTPAVSTRGMGGPEMKQIARLIGRVVEQITDPAAAAAVREEVFALTRRFPLPRFLSPL